MRLAKINNGKIEFALYGKRIKADGRIFYNPTEDTYRQLGYVEVPEIDVNADEHVEYVIENNKIVAKAVKNEEVPVADEIVSYSKLKLVSILKQKGYWNDVKAYIDELNLYEEFLFAQELRSDYPGFESIVEAFENRFPFMEVKDILWNARI